MFIHKQKINLIPKFFLEMLHFKESCNLTGLERFGCNSRTRILILPDMRLAMVSQELKINWRLSKTLITSKKSVWSTVFWYVNVYIFWKRIQYTIHWAKIQMLQKFPSDKINSAKNAVFYLSQAPTHHSFTFNLWFFYELKHKVCLSEIVCGIFHFQFRFIFINVYIFVQQKSWTLWL